MSTFDSARAMDHCTRIALPRLVGSEHERTVREYCLETFGKLQLHTSEQPFAFAKRAAFLLQVVPLMYSVVLLSLSLYFRKSSWIAICVLIVILFSITVLGRLGKHIGKLHFLGRTPHKSSNIIVHLSATQKEKQHYAFVAHYDSKSQTVPVLFRALCFVGLGMSVVLMVLNHLVSLYSDLVPFAILNSIFGYLAFVCGLLLFLNISRNRSPGAADNAAGAAIVLELARVLCKNPLHFVSCSFVLTGAEEFGLAGACYFAENHTIADNTRFINIDAVGGNTSVGMIIPKNGQTIAGDLKNIAAGSSISIKAMKLLPGAGFDHIPIAAAGYEAVTLCSRSLGMIVRLHSKKDTIETVLPEALQGIGELCERYVREMDTRS